MGFIGEDIPGEVPLGEPGMTTPIGGSDGTGADCVWVVWPAGRTDELELDETWPI